MCFRGSNLPNARQFPFVRSALFRLNHCRCASRFSPLQPVNQLFPDFIRPLGHVVLVFLVAQKKPAAAFAAARLVPRPARHAFCWLRRHPRVAALRPFTRLLPASLHSLRFARSIPFVVSPPGSGPPPLHCFGSPLGRAPAAPHQSRVSFAPLSLFIVLFVRGV